MASNSATRIPRSVKAYVDPRSENELSEMNMLQHRPNNLKINPKPSRWKTQQ